MAHGFPHTRRGEGGVWAKPRRTSPTKSLTGIDIAIIAVYFVVIFAIGFYFARKERTSTDYFLASRNVGWFAIGASLFVSNISTEHFIGLAGSGRQFGPGGGLV